MLAWVQASEGDGSGEDTCREPRWWLVVRCETSALVVAFDNMGVLFGSDGRAFDDCQVTPSANSFPADVPHR